MAVIAVIKTVKISFLWMHDNLLCKYPNDPGLNVRESKRVVDILVDIIKHYKTL